MYLDDQIDKKTFGSSMAFLKGGSAYRVCWGDLKERSHLGDLVLDGRTVLRWIFKKWDVGAWNELICVGIGPGGGLL
jgi:hypothetical protein